jgi:flagellar basal-body rod protein FlgG
MAQNLRLETTANNIANVNTPGFKKDQQVFQEYLTANEKPPEVIQVPKVPGSIESFYDTQGGDKSFVDTAGSFTDFSQGGLKPTGNTFDVAIEGKGFFEVATPYGVKLSRNGAFTLDGNGTLVTRDGYPVLKSAPAGTEPAERLITVSNKGPVVIGEGGRVFQGEEEVGAISVVNVTNELSLHKEGSSLYGFKQNYPAEYTAQANPNLKQGFLEASNVNIVQEMTDMITATRLFDSTQRAIQAYDNMADKLVNVVPKAN